jgi:predicted CopG family antitoxin
MTERRTITIRNEAYARLRKHGQFGETFSELLSRLLDTIDERGEGEDPDGQ